MPGVNHRSTRDYEDSGLNPILTIPSAYSQPLNIVSVCVLCMWYMYLCVHTRVCGCIWRSKVVILGGLSPTLPFFILFLNQGLSLDLLPISLAIFLADKPQGFSCPHPYSAVVTGVCHHSQFLARELWIQT